MTFFFLFIYILPSILLKEVSYSGSQFMLQLNKGISLFRLALTLDALYLSGGFSSSIWLTAQYLDYFFWGSDVKISLVSLTSIPSRNEISGPGIRLPRCFVLLPLSSSRTDLNMLMMSRQVAELCVAVSRTLSDTVGNKILAVLVFHKLGRSDPFLLQLRRLMISILRS